MELIAAAVIATTAITDIAINLFFISVASLPFVKHIVALAGEKVLDKTLRLAYSFERWFV